MGFFKVIGDIHANNKKFKEWENQESDNEAKRKVLQERHPLSAEEIATKQKVADTIIDTISIMDQHSEDVAEDVETITQPVTATSMIAGFLVSGIPGIKYLNKKANKSYKLKEGITEKLTKEQLDEIARYNNKQYVRTYEILSSRSKNYKNIKIPESLKEHVKSLRNEISKNEKAFRKYPLLVFGGIIATGMLSFLASVLVTTKMQVGSSRIARFQAREQLNDPKNFIIYTDEQIAQAKETLKNKPEEKKSFWSRFKNNDEDEKTGLSASFKNIKGLITDKKRYNKWKKQNANRDMRIMRDLTPEEVAEAKSDKEVIQRLTKKINNKAEEYSQNMETAAGTILGSSILGGPILGGAISLVLNMIGTGDKISSFFIKKFTNTDTHNIYKQMIKEKPDSEEYKKLKKQLFENIHKSVYLNEAELKQLNGKEADISSKIFEKMMNMGKFETAKTNIKELASRILSTPTGRNKALAFASGFVSTVVGMFIALKLQKQASRAGRYIAKEEFRNNPQEFVTYTDEQMQEVQDVKAEKETFGQKFKNYMMFLPTALKQHREYMNYKKGAYKEEKAIRNELIKLEVTPEQLREGKNLQRKLFNTFEKIDDKSQEYSENMEAAADIAMQYSQLAGVGAIIAPFVAIGAGVASGKISPSKLGVNVIEFLSRFSFIAKSKFFKKYISEVAENVEKKVPNIYYYKFELEELNSIAQNILDVLKQLNESGQAKTIESIIRNHTKPIVIAMQGVSTKMAGEISTLLKDIDMKDIKSISEKVLSLSEKDLACILKEFFDLPIPKMSEINNLRRLFNETGKMNLSDKELDSLAKLIKSMDKNISEFDKHIADFRSNHKNQINFIKGFLSSDGIPYKILNTDKLSIEEFIVATMKKEFDNLPENLSTSKLKETMSQIQQEKYNDLFTRLAENQKSINKGFKAFERIVSNIPVEELNSALEKIIKVASENPEKFAIMLNEPSSMQRLFMTKSLSKALVAAQISWGVFITGIIFAVQSYFAKIQKEAGRLGVMKAMEELQDDRIYADENPKSVETKTPETQNNSAQYQNLPENIKKLLNK